MHSGAVRTTLFVALFTAASVPVLAADPPASPTSSPSSATDPAALCAHTSMGAEQPDPLLPGVRDAAIEVRRVLCVNGGKREEILSAFTLFVNNLIEDNWFRPFGGFDKGDPLHQVLTALQTDGSPIPTIAPLPNDTIDVAGTIYAPVNTSQCDGHAGERGCGAVLDEFTGYYNYAHTTFASEGAIAFAQTVSGLSKEWSEYLNSTRAFTPLELLVNSMLYKRSETEQFSAPPDVQWIALHPNLVVENVEDAIDGENTKEALMIEIAGANWWRQTKWYVPTGGSIVMVYSDRPEVADWGYGFAVHFRSVYSIGYTRHDGEDGFLISFDLLKLVEDRKKVLESFRP
jgi:hypothetical protein